MDEQKNTQEQKPAFNPLIAAGVLFVLMLVGFGFVMAKGGSTNNSPTAAALQPTDQSTPQATPTDVTVVNVEGGNFYFKPNEIRVKQGNKVQVVFTSQDGIHDFVVDELNVKTERIGSGKSAQIEFTPDKSGTFEFYCSVGRHREMGMKGTIIVE